MKKILSALLIFMLLLNLFGCSKEEDVSKSEKSNTDSSQNQEDFSAVFGDSNEDSNDIKHTGKKIEGKITRYSLFSEGLAFVCTDGDKEKAYCITKDGYIVYEIDEKISATSNMDCRYKNGLVLINNVFYDKSGKSVTPESVGVTNFYDFALGSGYIVAEKITADYASAKKELGIMNLEFDWVVEPSEQLHQTLVTDQNGLWYYFGAYCYEDIVYFDKTQICLNLKTGETFSENPSEFPAELWDSHVYNNNAYYCTPHDDVKRLDLSNKNVYRLSEFHNGVAAVVFYNKDASACFFTLINQNGEFLFEPKQHVCGSGRVSLKFDGKYILITETLSSVSKQIAKCYDTNGNLLGEYSTEDMSNMSYSFDISDGVILLSGGYNYSHVGYYFNEKFEPLF